MSTDTAASVTPTHTQNLWSWITGWAKVSRHHFKDSVCWICKPVVTKETAAVCFPCFGGLEFSYNLCFSFLTLKESAKFDSSWDQHWHSLTVCKQYNYTQSNTYIQSGINKTIILCHVLNFHFKPCICTDGNFLY